MKHGGSFGTLQQTARFSTVCKPALNACKHRAMAAAWRNRQEARAQAVANSLSGVATLCIVLKRGESFETLQQTTRLSVTCRSALDTCRRRAHSRPRSILAAAWHRGQERWQATVSDSRFLGAGSAAVCVVLEHGGDLETAQQTAQLKATCKNMLKVCVHKASQRFHRVLAAAWHRRQERQAMQAPMQARPSVRM